MRSVIIGLSSVLLVAACGTVADPSEDSGAYVAPGLTDSASGSVECLTNSECEAAMAPGACETAQCVAGVCIAGNKPAGDLCKEDGLTLDICQVGRCDGAGTCAAAAAADGQPCGASDACQAQLCMGGVCITTEPKLCNDGNPCTDDVCDGDLGCTYSNNTAGCDDGNSCTENDQCADGECVSGDNTCECFSDAECAPMDTDKCDGGLKCVDNKCVDDPSTAVVCSTDGLAECQTRECVPATGECQIVVDVEGPCDDGNACTSNDYCGQNGNCIPGQTIVCEFNCGDNVDEDNDSVTDCEDEDCAASAACTSF